MNYLPVIWNANQFGISGAAFSFTTFATPFGTSPAADNASDTLTTQSTEATVTITGNAAADSINWHVPGALTHPVFASNTFEYLNKPTTITTGHHLLGLGVTPLAAVTSGDHLIAISPTGGMPVATNSSYCITLGFDILTSMTNGLTAFAVGSNIATNTTTPGVFVGVGNEIFTQSTSIGTSFALGDHIGNEVGFVTYNSTFMGSGLCANGGGSINLDVSGSVMIGSNNGSGTNAIFSNCFLIGSSNAANCPGSANYSAVIALGTALAVQCTTASATTLVGSNMLGASNSSTASSTLIGTGILNGNDSNSNSSVCIGSDIFNSVTAVLQSDIFIGSAGANSSGYNGSNNVVIGFSADKFTTAINNVILGSSSGQNITTGENNTIFGQNSCGGVVTGHNNLVAGTKNLQNADVSDCIVLGANNFQAASSGSGLVIIGASNATSITSAVDFISIGQNCIAGLDLTSIINIGNNSGTTCSRNNVLILLGHGSEPSDTASSHEMCVGGHISASLDIGTYFWGQGGLATATPSDVTFLPTQASGTDISGSNFIIKGGQSTGSGSGGTIVFQVSPLGGSGAGLNTYSNALRIGGDTNSEFFGALQVDSTFNALSIGYVAGKFTTGGGRVKQTRVVTAALAITLVAATDWAVIVNKTSGAATTVNLPASPTTGQEFVIKDGKGDAATNPITITPASGNIDGAATHVMNTNYGSRTVVYNGSQWNVI